MKLGYKTLIIPERFTFPARHRCSLASFCRLPLTECDNRTLTRDKVKENLHFLRSLRPRPPCERKQKTDKWLAAAGLERSAEKFWVSSHALCLLSSTFGGIRQVETASLTRCHRPPHRTCPFSSSMKLVGGKPCRILSVLPPFWVSLHV